MLKKRLLKNQKGLSAIVSTLIIILLVLVAAGIIWVVVRGIVQEGAEGIELGKFTLDLEIKAAQIENGDVTVVVVRRNPGEGNYIGMNFIFSDGTNSEIKRENTTLQELEEKSFTFRLNEIDTENLETISVAPIFKLSSGKESTGDVADSFEVTEEMKAGIIGSVISNFEALGFEGASTREYTISSQSEEVVKFTRVVVDPVDVLPGYNQTFTAYVSSPNGITNVTTVTELDNSTLNLDLELQGDDSWSATWTVYDTHTTTYRTTFIAWDTLGNSASVGLTWTDSCQVQIVHGAPESHISANCSTGEGFVAGVDGGSLIIDADTTLTIDNNSFLGFNDGESITITASGAKIVATSGGSFGNAYLFFTDSDGDNYAISTGLTKSSSSSLEGYIRASSSSLLGTTDCNDGNSGEWRSRYTDSDGDTHCPNSLKTCVGNDAGYRDSCTSYNDCCDTDSRARPDQTSYFNTSRTGGCSGLAYDFDCDSQQTGKWGTLGDYEDCEEIWNDEPECTEVGIGGVGWDNVGVPVCGVTDYYIIEPGWCDAGCNHCCSQDEQRAQACI